MRRVDCQNCGTNVGPSAGKSPRLRVDEMILRSRRNTIGKSDVYVSVSEITKWRFSATFRNTVRLKLVSV